MQAYDWSDPLTALEKIKSNILSAAKKEEQWYSKFRARHSFYSRLLRVISLVLFGFGIIWPITKFSPDYNLGYISITLGGILLLVDKYLGISSSYVRFYIAELDIKKNTLDFIENWDIETAKSKKPISQDNILTLLNLVKSFRQNIYTIIQVETGAWATEFQTQTGELYELFKQQQNNHSQSAIIVVTIENAKEYQDLTIQIDDEVALNIDGSNSKIFRNVSIKPHTISLHGTKNGEIITQSKNVEVKENESVVINFVL